jgi:hypothetical protein
MAEVINIIPINPTTFEYQEYSLEDTSLINSNVIDTKFDPSTDYIEYFIYNLNNELLYVNNLSFNNYRLIDNQLVLTPEKDLILNSFTEGQYNTLYNILSNKAGSSYLNTLYIQEISSDRTELRLNTTSIPNDELVQKTNEFVLQQSSEIGYLDFYINFGENKLVIANNILLDNSNPSDPTILIKLYEPLPLEFNIKTECWVSEKIAESVAYNISISQTFNIDDLNIKIKGPNLNLQVQDKINNTTNYTSYTNLKSTTSSQNSGSFYYQLNSILANKGITLNIDYSDYSQFVNLSSAQTRLENFYYKLSLIEGYQANANLSSGTPTNYYVSSSNILYQNKINDIITNFDNYEYHLYFESSSTSWPKTNSNPPYINAGTNSVLGQSFLISQSLSASIYDNNNNNNLINAIPSYILEDPNNNQYKLFIEMLGQMFDSIWIYIKDVTNKYNADNRLDYGVSKDLVAEVLTDLGFKLYQNNFSSDNLYSSYLGFTNSGSLYNIPYASNSLPAATGWEYINLFVTASATGSLIPTDDINKEVYKRIYHNLPYLLKTKGTVESLRTLLTIFGIPDTILRINEFGGKDKNPNTWDYFQNEYNYAFETTGSSKISIPFTTSTVNFGTVYPEAIEFRFKTFGLPTSNIPYSQSLLTNNNNSFGVVLEYTGSGYSSGSYNGSIIDPNYQYATLKFISGSLSSSVYLPFYDGGWWSVLINADSGSTTTYTLYAKNKIYNGIDGNTIGFQASSSFVGDKFWSTSGQLFFGTSSVLNTQTYSAFSGSYQEIRYYNVPLNESTFDAYVMNPSSIEGNVISGSQSSYNSLFFRLPLGGELYTGSTSVHPGITGSFVTQSFTGASSTGSFSGSYSFKANTETIFYDQPAVGIQNIVSNKLKIVNTSLPYSGSVDTNIPYNKILSPFISIQQNYYASSSYTNNIDYVEVAFSPQNEINEDIMSTLGYFNIGDYIGDPRQISSNDESYPDLDILRTNYFQKYFSNYDWNDYLRLIKFFDNSLFKTLQDFIPVKTSLASGAIIKQNLLERNKYPVPQMEFTQSEYTSSISMYEISGSDGGSMNITSIVTQSWTGTNPSLNGSVPFIQNSEDEFYNGQFSGSVVEVTNGELNDCNVEIIQVYTTSSLFTNINPNSAGDYFRSYNLNNDKTYYFSFTITEINGVSPGNLQLWNNGSSNNILYTSSAISAGGTLIVDKLELSKLLSPLTFKAIGLSSTGFSITNFSIFEAYTDSDCLPLLNNVIENRLNSFYMDVDYSNNTLTPVNQQLILSGSATRFAVPDSNYTAVRSINPRYNGSRTTSPDFNQPIYKDFNLLTTQSQIPNASRYSNWFVYFDYIENAYPEIPGGGNVHAVYAINTEGQAISLTGDNIYVEDISNIFPPGLKSTILPAVYSEGKKNPQVIIFDGGARYQTIIEKSGSGDVSTAQFSITTDASSINFSSLSFITSSLNPTSSILFSNSSNFLDCLLNTASIWNGSSYENTKFYSNDNICRIFNKSQNQYNTDFISPLDTYLPIQQYDLVRIGNSTGTTPLTILDSLFDNKLYSVSNVTTVNRFIDPTATSSLNIIPSVFNINTTPTNQTFRIFRRLPDETNIVLSTLPSFTDPGFLVPENFNPAYNPYNLAKEAGIIS